MNIEIYQDLFDKYLISDLTKIIKTYIRPLIYSKTEIQKLKVGMINLMNLINVYKY